MAGGGGVARLDGGDRGAHEALEEGLDVLQQPAVLQRHRRLRGEGGGEAHEALGVGNGLPLDGVHRGESPGGDPLAVDELQHADGLARGRPHRHDQHRLRAVARLLVEGAVDLEGRPRGRRVGVLEVQDLAVLGHVPGHALVADGQGELGERHRHEVVLRELEAQARLPLVRLLHEVDRARVAVRDLAGLGEDETEEGDRIPLGGQPHADRVELAQLDPRALRLGEEAQVLEGMTQRGGEDEGRHRLGQVGVPGRRPARGRTVRADQPDHRHQARPRARRVRRGGHVPLEVDHEHLGIVGAAAQRVDLRERVRLELLGKSRGHRGDGRAIRKPHDLASHGARVGGGTAGCQASAAAPAACSLDGAPLQSDVMTTPDKSRVSTGIARLDGMLGGGPSPRHPRGRLRGHRHRQDAPRPDLREPRPRRRRRGAASCST